MGLVFQPEDLQGTEKITAPLSLAEYSFLRRHRIPCMAGFAKP
jgi:hypothetical protein